MKKLNRRDFVKTSSLGTAGLMMWPKPTANAEAIAAAPENNGLRYRQIHLDFHTSKHIEGIGSAFDPEEFASTLKKASVDSVTCFGRCHHGFMYYAQNFIQKESTPILQTKHS